MALRRLILIADDYGISPGVSRGIRELAKARRLTGTGVMAAGLAWHVHGWVTWASPAEIVGMIAFIVMSVWKSLDDWAVRTGH